MTSPVPPDNSEQTNDLKRAIEVIEPISTQFPVSETAVPLQDVFDWLLDDVSTEERWRREQEAFQFRFAERWKAVASRVLNPNPREVSDQALANPDYDPLDGSEPWGVELTSAFRAAFAELGPVTDEAPDVLSGDERTRAFAHPMKVQASSLLLAVISYSPMIESEWQAVLGSLNEVIDLTLAFEGAMVVWLIGGFYRDVNGRLLLRPQLSLVPPPSGTRVKPIHVLLGTAYAEQCPSLLPLVEATRPAGPRLSDPLLSAQDWHRVVVQLDIAVDDYILLNLGRLSDAEREIARQVMYLDRQSRGEHALQGAVQEVIRPWQPTDRALVSPRPRPALQTRVLPPTSALEAAVESPEEETQVEISSAAGLRRDAEMLRRKGMALVASEPALAQKYLLASTVLENSSVDVWLKLVELATTEKQRNAFRREAEKALKRQRQGE